MNDTLVRCETCAARKWVSFAKCLREGWPSCHGWTMKMVRTDANIDQAVGAAVGGFGSGRLAGESVDDYMQRRAVSRKTAEEESC